MNFYKNSNIPFDKNDVYLYPDKEKFNCFFQDDLFGKEGKFFFPGNLEDASVVVQNLYTVENVNEFFSMYEFTIVIENKLKSWSCGTLACSALYYYLNSNYLNILVKF